MSIFRFRLSAIKQWPDIFKNLFSNYFLVVTTALILAGLWIYQIEAGDKLSFFASHNVFQNIIQSWIMHTRIFSPSCPCK